MKGFLSHVIKSLRTKSCSSSSIRHEHGCDPSLKQALQQKEEDYQTELGAVGVVCVCPVSCWNRCLGCKMSPQHQKKVSIYICLPHNFASVMKKNFHKTRPCKYNCVIIHIVPNWNTLVHTYIVHTSVLNKNGQFMYM